MLLSRVAPVNRHLYTVNRSLAWHPRRQAKPRASAKSRGRIQVVVDAGDDIVATLTGSHRRWLLDRGVRPEHIDTPWPLRSIGNNIGIDVIDGSGNLVDVANWDIDAKRIDSLKGVGVAIGEGLLDLGGHFPVPIWRSPCQWLLHP
jgi:hypothetical protein